MSSFSLLSAASCINAQPLCWANPSELKGGVNDTAMGAGGQWALFHWPWSLSSASSLPDPVPNLLSQQLYPFLSLPCLGIGMAWMDTAVVQPLFPYALKMPCLVVVTSTTKMGFFYLVAAEKIPYCRECPTHQTSCRVLSQWSSAGKCSLVQLRVQWVRKGPSRAQPVCDTLCISCLAPLGLLLGSEKMNLLLVPSCICTSI